MGTEILAALLFAVGIAAFWPVGGILLMFALQGTGWNTDYFVPACLIALVGAIYHNTHGGRHD